jgi:hypothetical protein
MKFRCLLCLVLLVTPGCANNPPPNLSPAGAVAYTNTRIIKGLDVLRDMAILANGQQPPLLSDATTRKIVTWHRSALQLINTSTAGWPTTVQTGLDETLKDLPPAESRTLGPYVALAKTLLTEATRP